LELEQSFKKTVNINLNNFLMKNPIIFMILATLLLTVSCKSTFNASKTLQNDKNRKELYQTIISDSIKFSEFLEVAANNKETQMLMMKYQMKMMEDGKMMEMMKDNPEIKKMMMKNMMEKMQKNPEMMRNMMEKMMEMMQENPEMMYKMKDRDMNDKKHSGH